MLTCDQEIERVQVELGFLLLRRIYAPVEQAPQLEYCVQAAQDRIDELQYQKLDQALHEVKLAVQRHEEWLSEYKRR